ncbi:MAG: DUF4242 domain-containing protein [Chitinophagaceae bacterium]
MKSFIVTTVLSFSILTASFVSGQTDTSRHLFIDVHQLQPGKVKFEDVAKAHAKDLATQDKHHVEFLKYWVDEEKGLVYCLSSASDSAAVRKTHAEAHGLLPAYTYKVSDGEAALLTGNKNLYLDIHYLGAGKVTAKDVAAAHQKDLAVQQQFGVSFINYWVNEKDGVVLCLSEAPDAKAIIETHKAAHGLIPKTVEKVKQGQ